MQKAISGKTDDAGSLQNGNPALSIRIGIFFTDLPSQGIHDIVDQHLIIKLDIVLQDRSLIKHGKSVTIIPENIIVAGQRIGFFRIQGLFSHHDILYTALPLNACEQRFFILQAGTVDCSVDLIGQTGYLQEGSGICRQRPAPQCHRR